MRINEMCRFSLFSAKSGPPPSRQKNAASISNRMGPVRRSLPPVAVTRDSDRLRPGYELVH